MTVLSTDAVDSYYGKAKVLRGVSINVEENETVGLLGRNGAGKTTLLKSLMGYQPPRVESGIVSIHGEDVTGLEPFEIARHGVGFVPEDREVFPELTVDENLEVGRVAIGDGTQKNWTKERIYEMFTELDDLRGANAESLSGGEQQMLSLGRTLMGNPSILLLDEPTEGLAPRLVQTVKEQIENIQSQTTVLLAEQNTEVGLNLSDRVYVIGKGKVLLKGTPDELRGKEEFERRIAI